MNKYEYLIRKPFVPDSKHYLYPAGSIQRQRIEKVIEQHGCEVVESWDNVVYNCPDSYKAAMIFSECSAAGLLRRI